MSRFRTETIGDATRKGVCEDCEGDIDDLNVEAWEETGRFLCEECAAAALEELAEGSE